MHNKTAKEFQNSFILGLQVIVRHPIISKNTLTGEVKLNKTCISHFVGRPSLRSLLRRQSHRTVSTAHLIHQQTCRPWGVTCVLQPAKRHWASYTFLLSQESEWRDRLGKLKSHTEMGLWCHDEVDEAEKKLTGWHEPQRNF